MKKRSTGKYPACLFALLFACLISAAPLQAAPVTTTHNGLTLMGEYSVAGGQQPSDHTVLLLHGTLAHHAMETIKNLQTILTERGINSLAVSLSFGLDKRTGMYDCATPHRHLYEDAAVELGVWFDWLAQKGVGDITLFGHSRGGAQVSMFAAGTGHQLLRRLMLMAPATWHADKAVAGFEKSHGQPLMPLLAEAQVLAKSGKGDQYMKGVGILYCPGADVTADSFRSYYEPNSHFDTPYLLPKIKMPVLVVTGDADTVVPDIAKRVAPLADGERIRLVTVEDADHFFLDLYGEDVIDALEEFIGD